MPFFNEYYQNKNRKPVNLTVWRRKDETVFYKVFEKKVEFAGSHTILKGVVKHNIQTYQ